MLRRCCGAGAVTQVFSTLIVYGEMTLTQIFDLNPTDERGTPWCLRGTSRVISCAALTRKTKFRTRVGR